MVDMACLLSDEEVQRFIVDGYTTVRADFPTPMHDGIYRKIDEVFEKEGNVGNNLLPRVPEIRQVFDHPVVRGALTSLLGPEYIMNPHRHGHLNPPGGKGGGWHKDCYVFDHNIRQPRFHWILALYYPQDVTEEMGPTAVLPQHQNYDLISDADPARTTEKAVPIIGPAGTIALTHFDAWHRACENRSDRKRYMIKFQFTRMVEPQQPTWNSISCGWSPPQTDEERPVSLDVWRWLCGTNAPTGPPAANGTQHREALLQDLRSADEATRLHAAFGLGSTGIEVVPDLLEALRYQATEAVDHIEDKTPANAHGTNPTALHAAQALMAVGVAAVPQLVEALEDDHWLVRASLVDVLANLGPQASAAIPALEECLGDDHWWVRRGAAEALGRMKAGDSVPLLAERLRDEDRRVRRMAALALAQIGRSFDGAVEALSEVLEDEDRYNRFYAGLALRRMDNEAAREVLLDALFTARWCPVTTPESQY